jgi:hypothetical protein
VSTPFTKPRVSWQLMLFEYTRDHRDHEMEAQCATDKEEKVYD